MIRKNLNYLIAFLLLLLLFIRNSKEDLSETIISEEVEEVEEVGTERTAVNGEKSTDGAAHGIVSLFRLPETVQSQVKHYPLTEERRYSRTISPYDRVFRKIGEREGQDWRLISAIAYIESRFDPTVVSHRGALGLMQIMPAVARQFGVEPDAVMEPETNVLLAAKLLKRIEQSLKLPKNAPYPDRLKFILACYNGGIGHVTDARRLADKYGYNRDSWDDVSMFLQLKSEPEYNQDEVVECGVFNGGDQTLSFVNSVMRKYDNYRTIAQM